VAAILLYAHAASGHPGMLRHFTEAEDRRKAGLPILRDLAVRTYLTGRGLDDGIDRPASLFNSSFNLSNKRSIV